ncbi:MAG: nuclear transport factor 2 family protein [Nitrosomonas sp.]|nr:MAG: nuclear transport factor 2 family protein [Nitrosomonas sp.]
MQDFTAHAKHYVALSNAHQLAAIAPLFAANATYHSEYFGEYHGNDAIHTMMQHFFERFADAHWEVAEYRRISSDGVAFTFIMTGVDNTSGEHVRRQGLEHIFFTPDGYIKHISVYKPAV